MNAAEVFDAILISKFSDSKYEFVRQHENMFSKETEETLSVKIELIKQRMAEGRDFNSICDDPDVFLGSLDRDYVYPLCTDRNIDRNSYNLPKWRERRLMALARDWVIRESWKLSQS